MNTDKPVSQPCKHIYRWEHSNGTICRDCGETFPLDKPVSAAEQFYDQALFCDDAELKASMKPHFVKFAEAYASSLREENERLKRRVEETTMYAVCLYCGEKQPKIEPYDREKVATMLAEHTEHCPTHPVHGWQQAEATIARLQADLLAAQQDLDQERVLRMNDVERLQEELREARNSAQLAKDTLENHKGHVQRMDADMRKAESQLESAQANARLWESNANEWKRLANRDKEQLEAIKRAAKQLLTALQMKSPTSKLLDVSKAIIGLEQALKGE